MVASVNTGHTYTAYAQIPHPKLGFKYNKVDVLQQYTQRDEQASMFSFPASVKEDRSCELMDANMYFAYGYI